MHELLLVPFLQALWHITLYAGGIASIVVIDDITDLAMILLKITDHTKNDLRRNGKLENIAHNEISLGMLFNRVLIAAGLALFLAIGAIVTPALAPLIAGVFSLAAGLYFAHSSATEIVEHAHEYHQMMKRHQPLSRLGLRILCWLTHNHALVRRVARTVHLHADTNPTSTQTDEEVITPIVKEANRRALGLTIQSTLVVAALALTHPEFVSIIAHASALGFGSTLFVFMAPLLAGCAVTWTIAYLGVRGVIKIDNIMGWVQELVAKLGKKFPFLVPFMQRFKQWADHSPILKQAAKAFQFLGRSITHILWPASTFLLTSVSGELVSHGWHHLIGSAPHLMQAMPALAPFLSPAMRGMQWIAGLARSTMIAAHLPAVITHFLAFLMAKPIIMGLVVGFAINLILGAARKWLPSNNSNEQAKAAAQTQGQPPAQLSPLPIKVTERAVQSRATTPVSQAAYAGINAAAPVMTGASAGGAETDSSDHTQKTEEEQHILSPQEALFMAWSELWHDVFGSHTQPVRHTLHDEARANVDPNE